jgi:dephospho-CoA kinase
MPEEEKCKRADFVITNDGIKNLKMQIDSVLNSL